MPKELTHIIIAQDVLAHLKGSGQGLFAQVLENNLPAFYLGAIIPDAFFYDMAPLHRISKGYAQISRALHSKETVKNDEKAVGFFDAIADNPRAWRSKAAFAAGIVTHTVSDRIIHGVIDYYTTTWSQKGSLAMATHRQIETLIDMVLLQKLRADPRSFQLANLLSIDQPTQDCLFRFYVDHLIRESRDLDCGLSNALSKAHAQQRLFLKLFAITGLYHIMDLSNKLAANRLAAWSALFYPKTIGTRYFPIMNRLDLNALTDGSSFTGTLASLTNAVTTDAIYHIRSGLHKL